MAESIIHERHATSHDRDMETLQFMLSMTLAATQRQATRLAHGYNCSRFVHTKEVIDKVRSTE